jgi:shikimate kinase
MPGTASLHVFISGFMGSGKTTVGRLLARQLSRPFIDLDEVIERRQGKTVNAIFSENGEAFFRELEYAALATLPATPHIVSLGGGTVCSELNLALIRSLGTIIYLNVPAGDLFTRLSGQTSTRPLLNKLNKQELRTFIEDLLEKRKPYYMQADYIVNGNAAAEQVAREIAAAVLL